MLLNQIVADFAIPATSGVIFKLSSTRGKRLVIYFYPKDDTPGCTTESQQFRDLYADFKKINCEVVGVSRDDLKSHEAFKAKFTLPFALLSDTEATVCDQFGVIKLKNLYGKQIKGIERSTFAINCDGFLIKEWRGIEADGHAQAVLQFIQSLPV